MSLSNMQIIRASRQGYVSDDEGFSGFFSWWRSFNLPGKWTVICHENSFAKETSQTAVTDDFGNLVRVPA